MKEVASKIQEMRSEHIAQILDGLKKTFQYGDGQSIDISTDELMIQREEKENLKILNDGDLTIGFDTDVTPELLYEGIARDLIRSIQTMRKESGFEVSDRINVRLNGDEDTLKAVEMFGDRISSETLALSVKVDNSLAEEEIRIEKA
jgi:isoleucyl-tRNA synthetase